MFNQGKRALFITIPAGYKPAVREERWRGHIHNGARTQRMDSHTGVGRRVLYYSDSPGHNLAIPSLLRVHIRHYPLHGCDGGCGRDDCGGDRGYCDRGHGLFPPKLNSREPSQA